MERCYFNNFKLNNEWKNIFFFHPKPLRGLRKYRKSGTQTQPGWIKLNFDAYGYGFYGYGGFLSNNEGEVLLSYAGPAKELNTNFGNDKDIIAAQMEGLRQGVQCFKQLMPNSCDDANLIIEGSALTVTRWANCLVPPPHNFVKVFKEMAEMLKGTNCIVEYIYTEANTKANELAKLGSTLPQFNLWK